MDVAICEVSGAICDTSAPRHPFVRVEVRRIGVLETNTMSARPDRTSILYRLIVTTTIAVLGFVSAQASSADQERDRYRLWIQEMKSSERGPFSRIRWFCEDGTILPPQAFACRDHGGGRQHGEWNERTQTLRAQGYLVANVLASIDADAFAASADAEHTLAVLLIERFLIAADDGWIFRRAQFYRGAIQEEDERRAGRELLIALSAKPEWIGPRYPLLRIAARYIPHGQDSASAQSVRQTSAALSERDPGFVNLRAKIHGAPEAADAERVRAYAAGIADAALAARYEALATEIDEVYSPEPLGELLERNAAVFGGGPWLQELLRNARGAIERDPSAINRFAETGRLLADLRDALGRVKSPSARLRVLDISLAVEEEHFRAASELRESMAAASRAQRIALLASAARAAYGSGFLNGRLFAATEETFAALDRNQIGLSDYMNQLRYLGLVPGWSAQGLRLYFGEAMAQLEGIEPAANLFIQDQLRGSPLLFYSRVLDGLARDANTLAGVEHQVFGERIGVGFNALNPGLARGRLWADPDMESADSFNTDGIYVVPETVAELRPVGGILTSGAGNPLSHVQLLARNFGIPNVAVDASVLPKIRERDGDAIVLAVSPAGLVELDYDGERWEGVFGDHAQREADEGVVIRPDLNKLDLSFTELVSLDNLRADDSGRTVGPKAAKLGELRYRFPETVASGFAVPFGVFRHTVLDQAHGSDGRSVFDWMVDSYREIDRLAENPAAQEAYTESFREELYRVISDTDPGNAFREALREAMDREFGTGFKGGVFVRSDTNVEDLPGFTGAGLNLTLPNVVGFDELVEGISRVWASPFTARAFAWRQSRMEGPEHVYPAVLVLQTVPSDVSGVMVTQDVESGDIQTLSIAVNEGVGGAVEGQAAESLRVNTADGSVRVLATATAPERMTPLASGGVARVPTTGAETLLKPDEIRQLIAFSNLIPERFPPIVDEQGERAAADVEFGFVDGKLWLFQIRPFNESRSAQGSAYLAQMDKALSASAGRTVDLSEVPR